MYALFRTFSIRFCIEMDLRAFSLQTVMKYYIQKLNRYDNI